MASKLHFNNVDGIVHFIGNKNLEEQTFASVVAKNNQLLKSLNSGVCFTMACWTFELLVSMGIKDDYYLMESANAHWPNTVILYKTSNGYRICDLAAQAQKNEATISELMSMARDYCNYREFYSEELLEEMLVKLNDSKYLCMSVEDYVKEYPIELCQVLMHHGCENMIYTDVPRRNLNEFLLEKQRDKKDR